MKRQLQYRLWACFETQENGDKTVVVSQRWYVVNAETTQIQSTWDEWATARKVCDQLNSYQIPKGWVK